MIRKVFRPSLKSATVFLGSWALVFFLGVASALHDWAAWPIPAISGVIWAFLGIWFLSHRIVIADNYLSYRTLFGGWKSIPLEQVQSVELEVGWKTYSDRFRPMLRLKVVPSDTSAFRPLIINLRVFKKEDISDLLQAVNVAGKASRCWN